LTGVRETVICSQRIGNIFYKVHDEKIMKERAELDLLVAYPYFALEKKDIDYNK
jgi:hypothetical protein